MFAHSLRRTRPQPRSPSLCWQCPFRPPTSTFPTRPFRSLSACQNRSPETQDDTEAVQSDVVRRVPATGALFHKDLWRLRNRKDGTTFKSNRTALSANSFGTPAEVIIVKRQKGKSHQRDQESVGEDAPKTTETNVAETPPVDVLESIGLRNSSNHETKERIFADIDNMRPSKTDHETTALSAEEFDRLQDRLYHGFNTYQMREYIKERRKLKLLAPATTKPEDSTNTLPPLWQWRSSKETNGVKDRGKARKAKDIITEIWGVLLLDDQMAPKVKCYRHIGLDLANVLEVADRHQISLVEQKWGVEIDLSIFLERKTKLEKKVLTIAGTLFGTIGAAKSLNALESKLIMEDIPLLAVKSAWAVSAHRKMPFALFNEPRLLQHFERSTKTHAMLAPGEKGKGGYPTRRAVIHLSGTNPKDILAAKRALLPPWVARDVPVTLVLPEVGECVVLPATPEPSDGFEPSPLQLAGQNSAQKDEKGKDRKQQEDVDKRDRRPSTSTGQLLETDVQSLSAPLLPMQNKRLKRIELPGFHAPNDAVPSGTYYNKSFTEHLSSQISTCPIFSPHMDTSVISAVDLAECEARTIATTGYLMHLSTRKDRLKQPITQTNEFSNNGLIFWPASPNTPSLLEAIDPPGVFRNRKKLNIRLVPDFAHAKAALFTPELRLKFSIDTIDNKPPLQNFIAVLNEKYQQFAIPGSTVDLQLRCGLSRNLTSYVDQLDHTALKKFIVTIQESFAAQKDVGSIPVPTLAFSNDPLPRLFSSSSSPEMAAQYLIAEIQIQENLTFMLPPEASPSGRAFPASISCVSADNGSHWTELSVHFGHDAFQVPDETERADFGQVVAWLISRMDKVRFLRSRQKTLGKGA